VAAMSHRVRYLTVLVVLCTTWAFGADREPVVKVRKPIYAGSFYPADRSTLDRVVGGFLKRAEEKGERTSPAVFGILAPHAGYEYSGQVAAHAYAQVKGTDYSTVILIGPSHQVAFKGISVYTSGPWETPLGTVQMDTETAHALMQRCTSIKPYPEAFAREHSLEVELPFLQKALKSFRLVPLVTGAMEDGDYQSLARALTEVLRSKPTRTLIVVSSDMSHYHSYNEATTMDKLALRDIEGLHVAGLRNRLRDGDSELCGAPGVITLMMVAQRLDGSARALTYANSGDVTGDKGRVVGYGAVAFSLPKSSDLNRGEQDLLLSIARKTLEACAATERIPEFTIKEKRLQEKRGAFVTLTKKGQLRGCIGYVIPVAPLHKAVSDMAVAASTQDPRFQPVSGDEVKDVDIEISVLSPLRLIQNIDEIEVGNHGLYVVQGNRSGLLLPQVAAQYMWSKEEFLRQTCFKAGLPAHAWKDPATQIYTFSAQVFSE
jgi:MEMO1 family protein